MRSVSVVQSKVTRAWMERRYTVRSPWRQRSSCRRRRANLHSRWGHCDLIIQEHDGVSNYKPHQCLLNRLFRPWSKKTSKLRVTGLCVGNSLVTQMASNAVNVSTWWRHHGHCDAMEWKCVPHYWPFVRRIRRWTPNSHHKGPAMKNFDVSFDDSLNKLLNK